MKRRLAILLTLLTVFVGAPGAPTAAAYANDPEPEFAGAPEPDKIGPPWRAPTEADDGSADA